MTIPVWQCGACARLTSNVTPFTCEAFPGGIPQKIVMYEHIHTEPFEGDGGLLFQPKADKAART